MRPEDGKTKKWPTKVDAKERPRHLRKTFIFPIDFAIFALRDPFGGRSRRALHVQNYLKTNIAFTDISRNEGGPS